LNSKLTDKDKKDWKNFTSSSNKVKNKDNSVNIKSYKNKIIDLHGFSLDKANQTLEVLINKSYQLGIEKIIVITGKGIRSKTANNPYLSEELSILKNSVPEFIKSNLNLMSKIKKISEADVRDGGSGAFYIYLKKFKE
jgi:DNA-nicking Smr family endonuclease